MLLGVQVDTTGPLLDGHDWEANVDAAMKFSFLNLGTFFSVNSVHPIIFSSTDVSGIPNQGELNAGGFSALTVGYSSSIVIVFAKLRKKMFNLVKDIFIYIHM